MPRPSLTCWSLRVEGYASVVHLRRVVGESWRERDEEQQSQRGGHRISFPALAKGGDHVTESKNSLHDCSVCRVLERGGERSRVCLSRRTAFRRSLSPFRSRSLDHDGRPTSRVSRSLSSLASTLAVAPVWPGKLTRERGAPAVRSSTPPPATATTTDTSTEATAPLEIKGSATGARAQSLDDEEAATATAMVAGTPSPPPLPAADDAAALDARPATPPPSAAATGAQRGTRRPAPTDDDDDHHRAGENDDTAMVDESNAEEEARLRAEKKRKVLEDQKLAQRKRGNRMFGMMLGTLQRAQKEVKLVETSGAGKKRLELQERLREKLDAERKEAMDKAERERELRELRTEVARREDEIAAADALVSRSRYEALSLCPWNTRETDLNPSHLAACLSQSTARATTRNSTSPGSSARPSRPVRSRPLRTPTTRSRSRSNLASLTP